MCETASTRIEDDALASIADAVREGRSIETILLPVELLSLVRELQQHRAVGLPPAELQADLGAPSEVEPPATWPRPYRCYVCERAGRRVRAEIRIFAGTAQGGGTSGGFAVCAAHRAQALADAFFWITDGGDVVPQWKVRAYRIRTSDGAPCMEADPLWVAAHPAKIRAPLLTSPQLEALRLARTVLVTAAEGETASVGEIDHLDPAVDAIDAVLCAHGVTP